MSSSLVLYLIVYSVGIILFLFPFDLQKLGIQMCACLYPIFVYFMDELCFRNSIPMIYKEQRYTYMVREIVSIF